MHPQFATAPFYGAFPFSLPATFVNETTVLGIPALWSGVNLIANTAANCAPKVFDGFAEVEGTFVDKPAHHLTPYEFYSETVSQLVLNGNSFQFIIWRDNGFEIDSLVPMPADTTVRLVDGYPVFEWQGNEFSADQVIHLRGLTQPGSPKGVGVIEAHRRGLGIVIDQQQLQSATLRTGGTPSVVIEMPVNASNWNADNAATAQTAWVDSFAGAQKRPAMVPQGTNVTTLGLSAVDMEFLASRAFSVAEVAMMLGLDAMDLNATISGEAQTYQNLETRETARMKRIAPWFQRIEQKFNEYLAPTQRAKFISERQLRTDTKARYESYNIALEAGFLTVNEVRELEGRPPLQEQAA
ncbi:MAG: phage portal protein [Ilumatobacteraceae bacterium]